MNDRRWILLLVLLLIAAGAFAFRFPQLTNRPFHGDEAIHAVKFSELLSTGVFAYDPEEYHGPTLHYFTLPVMRLTGRDYLTANEVYYRIVPVIFCAGLIPLLWLIRRELGAWPTLWAAIFTAISSAMVFYSRYYIQEMLLVFFTFLAIVGGTRYARGRKAGWALLCGVGLGMMHATKETSVIAMAAMGAAAVLTMIWVRFIQRDREALRGLFRWGTLAAAALVAVLVASVFLSGFFMEAAREPTLQGKLQAAVRGPWSSITSYAVYFDRGTGNSDHNHPWDYYLRLLGYTRYGRVWFSEGLILALAAIGALAVLLVRLRGAARPQEVPEHRPVLTLARQPGEASGDEAGVFSTHRIPPAQVPDWAAQADAAELARGRKRFGLFLLFYTLILTAAYSAISYKTPWCMLSFLHAMILLAGIGAAALVRLMRFTVPQVITILLVLAGGAYLGWREYQNRSVYYTALTAVAAIGTAVVVWLARRFVPMVLMILLLLAGSAHLAWQAYRINYQYPADSRLNPYVYSQPGRKMHEIVQRIEDLARVSPDGRDLSIRVFTIDIWPIPWYLRHYPNLGCWPDVASARRQAEAAGIAPEAIVSAPVVITSPELQPQVAELLKGEYANPDFFGLRPHTVLIMHVRADLWDKFIQARQTPPPR